MKSDINEEVIDALQKRLEAKSNFLREYFDKCNMLKTEIEDYQIKLKRKDETIKRLDMIIDHSGTLINDLLEVYKKKLKEADNV